MGLKNVYVQLPEEVHAAMKTAAARRRMTIKDLLHSALAEYLAGSEDSVDGPVANRVKDRVVGDGSEKKGPGRY